MAPTALPFVHTVMHIVHTVCNRVQRNQLRSGDSIPVE